ncbi:hypothetical protein MRB53_016763 [Persea americana]|uniref:Uncharacterized protein n=1 Tax=Persea americana TaxID=3435 RepID=A0ACC2M3B0_PERAE|nr:hypothetical protein MRB53_016763 [Persea americana]
MESAGSWDAIEWTKIEPMKTSVSHGMSDLLLPAEEVIVKVYGVVLVNTDEPGTLLVTNFRLLLVSEGTMKIIALGTIPLATIEKFSKPEMMVNQEVKLSSNIRRQDEPETPNA